ncbi:MAG: tRNA pseudouridine(55) synthase TruB [Casimicrobiaceae bacterium]
MAAQAQRPPRQRVDGVLLLDKPLGLSSNAALQLARRAFDAQKAGHTGTLDPLASGLLPLCFGEATKFARFLLDADKRYTATVRFGVSTTTQDAEGAIVATAPVNIDSAAVDAALARFRGTISQVPPAYSALKHQGRSHYEYARAGIDVPRAAREVRIDVLTLSSWRTPDAILDVACSKGTYIRALAADLGAALGCGAHLAALRREATGGFVIGDAIKLDALEAMAPQARTRVLLPVDTLLAELPHLAVDAGEAQRLRDGRPIAAIAGGPARYRVYAPEGALIGVVIRDGDTLVPERMSRTTP